LKLQRLGIDIVGGCNLKCIGCPNSILERKIQFTSVDNFNLYLSNINVKHIEFLKLYNFGESLLHPDLKNILAQIPKQKWKVRHVEISTNGQIVNRDKLEALFSSRLITRFGVSCDGNCTPEEYVKLRPGGKWEKLIEFLKLAQEIRRQYKSSAEMFLKILCTGNKNKWNKMAKELGYDIQWRKWRAAPDSIKYKDEDVKVPNHVCKHVKSTRVRCYVDWDGDVIPCCNHPKAFVFGNLRNQKYTEIYKGALRKRIIIAMNHRRNIMPICGRCEIK
jgi:radical SAM protein with 4Fe4S-binding SPASM domain